MDNHADQDQNLADQDENITLDNVMIEIFDARSKWYFIGLALGVDNDTLRAIREQSRGVIDECLRETLDHRLRMGDLQWSNVVQALRTPGVAYWGLANRIAGEKGLPVIVHQNPAPVEGVECYISSFKSRMIAEMIDWIPKALLFSVVMAILHIKYKIPQWLIRELLTEPDSTLLQDQPFITATLTLSMCLFLSDVAAETMMLAMFSTTLGKWTMGLKVWTYRTPPAFTNTVPGRSIIVERDEPTTPLGALGTALGRTVCKRIVGLAMPVFYPFFYGLVLYWVSDDTLCTPHDKAMKTIVVRNTP